MIYRICSSLLVILFSIFSISIFAQTATGFSQLKDGDLAEAKTAFESDTTDKKMAAFAYYGLATIYADSTFSNYNLDTAWTNWLTFNAAYKELGTKTKEKYKKEFKIRSVKLKNKISEAAVASAEQKNTVADYDHFLTFYKRSSSKYRKPITLLRNQRAFDDALELNNSKDFKVFLGKYEKSLKANSSALYKAAEKRYFELSMAENGWDTYPTFAKKNPRNPYVKDAGGKIYRNLQSSVNKRKLQDFLDAHPESLYQKFALDELAIMLPQDGSLTEFNWFLLSYPDHEATDDLWKKYFDLYLKEKGQSSVVEFSELYPNYPFLEDLQKEKNAFYQKQEGEAFAKIKNSKDGNVLLEFLEQFPQGTYTSQIQAKYLKVIQQNPSIYAYEKYMALSNETKFDSLLLPELYEMYSYNLSASKLERFAKKYGVVYPDTARMKKDWKLAERYSNLPTRPTNSYEIDQVHQFIQDAAPSRAAYGALVKLIQKDLNAKNWTAAEQTMRKYESIFQEECLPYNQLLNTLNAPNKNVRLTRLNSGVNTKEGEYAPVISADGELLYFCSKGREDNLGGEDIFISQKKNKQWMPATLMEGINTFTYSEAPEAISVDGTQMLLFKSGRLAFSNKTESGWSEIELLPRIVNTTKWQGDASLASNGKAMLFVSAREDIIGFPQANNKDIYVCLKNEKGEWAKVINLGQDINTPYLDRSPFLHPDMKTLYFSSLGHGGLGDLDVFKSTRLDDTWTNWSTPVNLGREINTPNRDWGYKVSTDGKTAYFSFAPEGMDTDDIYEVELPQEMRPQAVSTVSGILEDSEGLPIDAEIIIEDLVTGEEVAKLRSNPQTGKFFVVLPDNRKYSYRIAKENYFPIASNIDLTGNKVVEIKENLDMYTFAELTEKGVNITLDNIFFDTDKFVLKPESASELNRLFALIKTNNFKVELFGHTDSDGDPSYNLTLSQNRADAVRNYLIEKGIPQTMISAKGLGETKPVEANATAAGKAKNRRVEISFSN